MFQINSTRILEAIPRQMKSNGQLLSTVQLQRQKCPQRVLFHLVYVLHFHLLVTTLEQTTGLGVEVLVPIQKNSQISNSPEYHPSLRMFPGSYRSTAQFMAA